jgi:hypothetical protein
LKGGVLGIVSPAYTWAAVLWHGGDNLQLIGRNLFSPAALPTTVAFLVALLLRRRVYAVLTRGSRDPELEQSRRRFATLYPFILGVQLASIVASGLGLYPWDIASRWSAYLVMLSAVAAVVLSAEGRSLALAALAGRADTDPLVTRVRVVGVTFAVLLALAASARLALHRRSVEAPHRTNVATQIDQLPFASLGEHAVFVAFYEVPMVRYLYEYGPYRGRPEYPRVFRFETPTEWAANTRFSANAEGTSFIVSALTLAEAQALFPGVAVRPFGPDGSRLLAVVASAGVS